MKRNLSGMFFRVERSGKFENICFEELSTLEQADILKEKSKQYTDSMVITLANTLKEIGEQLDLVKK